MKFAHFSHIWAKPGMTPHQRYEQLWRELRIVRRARLRSFLLRRASFPPRRKLDVVAEPLCGRRRRAHQAAAHRADGLYRAALSSAAARRRDRDRRSDARRPHGARSRSRHQSGLFPAVRPRLRRAQIADARIRRLSARGLRRDAAVLVSRRGVPHRLRRACGHAGAAPASAVMDDEPRSADARILRQARHQPRLLSGLSARRRRAALSQVSGGLEAQPAGRKSRTSLTARSVYVDETDEKALDTALFRASRAYEGFLRAGRSRARASRSASPTFAKMFIGRGEPGASEIMAQRVQPRLSAQARSRFHRLAGDGRRKNPRRRGGGRVQYLHGRVQFLRLAGARPDALDPAVRRKGDSGACATTSRFDAAALRVTAPSPIPDAL